MLKLVPRTTQDSKDTRDVFMQLGWQCSLGNIVGAAVICLERGDHYTIWIEGDAKRRASFVRGLAGKLGDALGRYQGGE